MLRFSSCKLRKTKTSLDSNSSVVFVETLACTFFIYIFVVVVRYVILFGFLCLREP